MRIDQIRIYQYDLPVKGKPYRMSLSELTALDTTIVEIVTDTGIKGYGETCPLGSSYQPQHANGARAALVEMSPHLLGLNPLHIEAVTRKMTTLLMGHNYAKAAIDIALWDIVGKANNMRICDLLGGAIRERIPAYYAIGPESPGDAARIAAEKQAEGYPRLQMKVGGRDVHTDVEAIHKVAGVLQPGIRLATDANRGWTVRDALQVSQACRDITMVIEQPCATFEEIASLRGRLCHPLYMDETAEDINAVLRCIGDDVADGFGFKMTRVGGISAMRTIRDICKARNLSHTCDDSWGGDIVAAACVHIAATVEPHLFEGTWVAAPYIDGHYDAVNGVATKHGWLELPSGPGLGIAPDTSLFGDPVASFSGSV